MFSENDLLFKIPETSILSAAKGAFAKRIGLIVCDEPNSPENTDFLKKVLESAGLDLGKDTLCCIVDPEDQYVFTPLIKTKQAESVLVFGLRPEQLGLQLNCALYEPLSFYGTTIVFADKLSKIQADTTLKRNLWQALQQLYLK